jgi:PHD/YefM family antitoxin component YafN of YafNO toxin-antitoxin module
MSPKLHPVFLKKNGKSEFVVLPFDEYTALQELLSDYQDLLELRMAKQDEEGAASVSLEIVKAELGL